MCRWSPPRSPVCLRAHIIARQHPEQTPRSAINSRTSEPPAIASKRRRFRPSWIRTPGRMQNTFANECFIDEIAAAVEGRSARVPPATHRPRRQTSAWRRWMACHARKWRRVLRRDGRARQRRQGARLQLHQIRTRAHLCRGRLPRSRSTARAARFGVTDFYVAHDCGQIINPSGVKAQIEGCHPDGQPNAEGGVDLRSRHGDEPRLGELSDPDLPGVARRSKSR